MNHVLGTANTFTSPSDEQRYFHLFFMGRQDLAGLGLLTVQIPPITQHSLRLLRTTDRPVAEHLYVTTLTTHNKHQCPPPVLETAISTWKRPQIQDLARPPTII
jgi:hypothetical protein